MTFFSFDLNNKVGWNHNKDIFEDIYSNGGKVNVIIANLKGHDIFCNKFKLFLKEENIKNSNNKFEFEQIIDLNNNEIKIIVNYITDNTLNYLTI